MHILMTNDDGINSPFLHILVRAAAKRGHTVTVSAPQTQQSGKSHSFTLNQPLFVRECPVDDAKHAYAVNGTPVDSARLGFMNLAEEKVDLVISGINDGLNAGLAVYVSGTVGAAREAAFQDIPAMAVSVERGTDLGLAEYFADYCIRTGEKLVNSDVPEKSVCNVNLPPVHSFNQIQGSAVCSISHRVYHDQYERRVSPRGDVYFWLTPIINYEQIEEGCDLDLLDKGFITITFLAPDTVDQQQYQDFPIPLCE